MFISGIGYNISCLGNTMDMISMHNGIIKAQMRIIGFFDQTFFFSSVETFTKPFLKMVSSKASLFGKAFFLKERFV
jgi:hypothetical protein